MEGGYTQPSPELIKVYARLGGSYTDLMALLDKAKRTAQPAARTEFAQDDEFDRQLLDLRSEPLLLRRGYVVDLQEDTVHLDSNGAPNRNVYRTSVRPLSPNARYFVFRYGHENDPRRGVASAQAGAACEIELTEENDEGVVYVVINFGNGKLDEFGRYTFTWVINIASSEPSQPYYAVHTRSQIRHLITRVQFEPPALPNSMWWFRGTDPFENRMEPAVDHVLDLNPTNFYLREFYDVNTELCGLAWRWNY
ncbi:MAG TPA: hypothetical protein VJ836_01000 [Candidatus Saccharimonadales bacterium]|nr:hypothetical protein [Candidatus Saccharimonadales bacterium]